MRNEHGELRQIKAEELEEFLKNPTKFFNDVTIVTSYSYSLIAELMNKIELPEGIEIIDDEAFAYNDVRSYKFPKTLRVIGNNAFAGSVAKSFNIPDSVNFIGKDAFSNCRKLEKIKLPKNLKYISSCMFWNDTKLKKIDIPKSVTQIRESAFEKTALTQLDLPEVLELIDEKAFMQTRLTSVKFPNSLLSIGYEAFRESSLESVSFNEGLEEIGDCAFDRNDRIKKIDLPKSLIKLGKEAFYRCSDLEKVTIGDNLEELESGTFYMCKNLVKIALGKGIKSIGAECFFKCESLENIDLPNGLEKIDMNAFAGSEIKSLFIPRSIKYIGANILGENYYDLYIDDFTGEFSLDGYSEEKKFKKSRAIFKSKLLHLDCANLLLVPILIASNNNKKLYDELLKLTDIEKVMCASLFETFGLQRVLEFISSAEERKTLKNFEKQIKFLDHDILEEGLPNFQEEFYGACKLLIALGVFEQEFSQKATSYVANLCNTNDFSRTPKYGKIKLQQNFNPTFARYIMNNSHRDELLKTECIEDGIVIYLYNNYETLRGYLKNRKQPTMSLAKAHKKVFSKRLLGLNKETLPIAIAISKYYLEEDESLQDIFDRAVHILKIKEANNVPDHILSFNLNEKDIFSRAEEKLSKAEAEAKITINILKTLAEAMNVIKKDNPYYFEYLNKGLVDNLALGIDVDCCAHLGNVGEGIAVQSVINPNTQNLVITDKKGQRVAKAVFTICPEEGYGVFNNVEIKNSVLERIEDLFEGEYQQKIKRFILDKVMVATYSFLKCYNKEHPDMPLKKFYMGVVDGDLAKEFAQMFKPSTSKEDLTRNLDKVHYPNENGIAVYHSPMDKVVICYDDYQK